MATARMEDVAKSAGVAVGTLYNHVGDRDQLLRALLDDRRAALLERLDESIRGKGSASFEELFRALLETLAEHFHVHGRLFVLLREEERAGRPAPGRESTLEAILARIQQVTDRGVRSGALRVDHAELFAPLLLGMVRGLMVHRIGSAAPLDGDAVHAKFRALGDVFLEGARKRG